MQFLYLMIRNFAIFHQFIRNIIFLSFTFIGYMERRNQQFVNETVNYSIFGATRYSLHRIEYCVRFVRLMTTQCDLQFICFDLIIKAHSVCFDYQNETCESETLSSSYY